MGFLVELWALKALSPGLFPACISESVLEVHPKLVLLVDSLVQAKNKIIEPLTGVGESPQVRGSDSFSSCASFWEQQPCHSTNLLAFHFPSTSPAP